MSMIVWESLVVLVGLSTSCEKFIARKMPFSFFVSLWDLAPDMKLQFRSPIIITSFSSAKAICKTSSNASMKFASKKSEPSGGR